MKAWPLLVAPALFFGGIYVLGLVADDPKAQAVKAPAGPSVSASYYPEPSKNGFQPAPPQDGRPATVVPKSLSSMLADVQLNSLAVQKQGFGAVLVIAFSIRNGTDIHIKDPLIECSLYGKSGTKIDTASARLYERLPPGQERRIRELNMGFIHNQASSVDCRVTHFERA
jgi:hypothetical protein